MTVLHLVKNKASNKRKVFTLRQALRAIRVGKQGKLSQPVVSIVPDSPKEKGETVTDEA